MATLSDGKKLFVWGGLPGEKVAAVIVKQKSSYCEAIVTGINIPSPERVPPQDPESYLSTSPWQIMSFDTEQHYKAALIEEAFELHDIVLPEVIDVYTDGREYEYRNKVEFSWYGGAGEDNNETLDLAFFRRGSKGKIVVDGSSLLQPEINSLAIAVRNLLRTKPVTARNLKTLLIRCDQAGNCVWQLYIKDEIKDLMSPDEAAHLPALGGEIIYSDPRSPASRITKRLESFGHIILTDSILGVPFRYATEGFFQVNIPVYEQALSDIKEWVNESGEYLADQKHLEPVNFNDAYSKKFPREAVFERQDAHLTATTSILDLYAGVGSIGLTVGGKNVTLVEINEDAVREMRRNIAALGREDTAQAILAPSEKALEYITSDMIVIIDPPRAGLHLDVIERLLEVCPPRIIYLSCNPVTQARDIALLAASYGIRAHRGYNFFPRTPHIEHLVILDRLTYTQ